MKNYYSILGIPYNATSAEIKKAFRLLAKKHHPDVNTNEPGNDILFKEIQEAYTVLSNTQKRIFYDQKLQYLRNKPSASHKLRNKTSTHSNKGPISFHYAHADFSYGGKRIEENNPIVDFLSKQWRKIPWIPIYATAFGIGWIFCFVAMYIKNPYLRETIIFGDKLDAFENHPFILSVLFGIYYGFAVMLITAFILTPIIFLSLYAYSFVKVYSLKNKKKNT